MSLPISESVLSVAQMRAAEQAAVDAGVSEWDLMQRASRNAAEWVRRLAAGRAVTVLCGPGNNGGDGYVIAQCLAKAGNAVQIIAPEAPKTQTASKARKTFEGSVSNDGDFTDPVIVDCLFGYGLSRPLSGSYADLVERLARHDGLRIAIDVPSGVHSDSGDVLGPVPNFQVTLALGAWKRAHWTMPATAKMGTKKLIPLGLETAMSDEAVSRTPKLSAPAAGSHKYKRGLLAIVTGDMPGAPLLAAEAAMHAGAGYIKMLSPHSHPAAPADLVILDVDPGEGLADPRIAACLVGPGLGRGETSRARLSATLESGKPSVVDADALHLLDPDLLEGCDAARLIVTPHEGELAALCKNFDVKADTKRERAIGLHQATGLTVLAKGADTMMAVEAGFCYFSTASSWLSTAGTGDVLAGIIASRLAFHGDPFRAAEEAVWLHREAAHIAAPAFSASQLAKAVKPAMSVFL